MTSIENDAIISQIFKRYQTSWEQSRLVASAFGGSGIEFPWDNDNDILEPVKKELPTPQELKETQERYLKYIESKNTI
jgi:hypothetical protein